MALHIRDHRSDGEALHGSTPAVRHAATELCIIGAASGIGAAAVGLSVDLDAIDPTDAPGIGTPAPNGLRGLDLVESLRWLAPQSVLAEIAEFNPLHDREDKTARLVIDLLAACWSR